MRHQYNFNPQTASKLLELNKLLTQSLKLESVLQNVIAAASELIEIADTFIVYLYDESADKLKLAEGKGIHEESLKKVAFDPGESIAGKVFRDREPKLFTSEQEIDRYMSNMSKVNYRYYYKGVYKQKIKSAFCVPILNRNRCLGVLVVDNFKENGIFAEEDMQVIRVVAEQSAIAIENSNVYHNLKEKNDLLAQSISIHTKYYRLIIEGGGMNEIISLLESLIDSKVDHYPTNHYEEDQTVFPIKRGNEVMGILKLGQPFNEFSRIDQVAIENASLAIAIDLMKDHALLENELQFREEVFNQMIEGISEKDIHRIIHYFNWDEDWHVQCMIIEGNDEPLWRNDQIKDKERLVRSIEHMITDICGHSLILTRAFQLIVIFPSLHVDTTHNIIKNIKSICRTANQLLFGVGRQTTIHHIATSYQEAIRSIGYAKSSQDVNIVEYAKLGAERLLHNIDDSTADLFIRDKLGKLLIKDRVLLDTLKAFANHHKQHNETAAYLHIHVNTLYYRLKRIEALLDINLKNEQDWFDIVIALRLFVASNKN